MSPCPGQCFAHAATPAPWSPRTNARDVARGELGRGAERAHADDRAQRIGGEVGDGREVEVDAAAREVAAERRRDALRQLDVVDGAERPVPGVGAALGAARAA